MSRARSVPLVRMENGVPDSARAEMIPGIRRYRPSARWYGSVFVPRATWSRFHEGLASSRASTSAALIFTTSRASKSSPVSRFR